MTKKDKAQESEETENDFRVRGSLALIFAIVSGVVVTGFAAFTAIFWYMIRDIDGDVRAVKEQTDKIEKLSVLIAEIHTNTSNTKEDVARLEILTNELDDRANSIDVEFAKLPEKWNADVATQVGALENGVLDINSQLAGSIGMRIGEIETNTNRIDILQSELQQMAVKLAGSSGIHIEALANHSLDEESLTKYLDMLEEMNATHLETQSLTSDFRKLCTNITRSDARALDSNNQSQMAQYLSQFRQTQLGEHVRFHKGCLGPTLVVDLNESALTPDQESLLNRLVATEDVTVLYPLR